ncbi:MAG: DUF1232 domain-containing protein [Firmicutes bacterium]|nr:DUF1232 domain-containing protein [Bacillota bacterium]MBR3053551.1 DUF1232 domain-containing protein [Bacillota bacterium]MBR3211615.1 DUF1232 domain-containing protein [Bacillota bacterium]
MFDFEQVKSALENRIGEAQEMLKDPDGVSDLLAKMETKVREIPVAADLISDVPLMIGMVKGYINRTYESVSPKVIAILVAAFIYLVKRKDLVPDGIPILGLVDDLAVLGLALKLSEPELKAFKAWQEASETPVEA